MPASGPIVRAYDAIVVGLAVVAGIIPLFLLAATILSVLIRELGFQFFPWLQAYIEYGLLYSAVLAAPWLVRTRGHVFVEAFITMMSRPVRRGVEIFVYLACIVAALVFAYYSGIKLVQHIGSGEYETRSVDMPLWLLYLPMPFSFFLVAVEFGRFLFGGQSMYSSPAGKGD